MEYDNSRRIVRAQRREYWQPPMGAPNRFYRQWNRYRGVRQRPFAVGPRMDAQARARRVPWMNRRGFAQAYGEDADYDQWNVDRQYRAEDLADPVVFNDIVLDRKARFARQRYADVPDNEEVQQILYEGDIATENVVRKRARFEDD